MKQLYFKYSNKMMQFSLKWVHSLQLLRNCSHIGSFLPGADTETGFGCQSLIQEVIPGSTSRWAENGDREGKAASPGHVVKQVTPIDKWSSVLLGNYERLRRPASVLFILSGEGGWGIYPPIHTWKLSLLSLSLFPQPEKNSWTKNGLSMQ